MSAIASAGTARRLSSRAVRRLGGPAMSVAAALALFGGTYYLSIGQVNTVVTLLALLTIAQAWNIVAGFAGQVSLGSSAFVGVGSYATVLLLIHTGMTLLDAVVLASVIGGLLAAIISPAVFRLRGPYFTVGTLGLALGIQAWMENWGFSNGTQAVLMPPNRIPAEDVLYRYAVVVAVLTMVVTWLIRRSNFGLRLMAIRDNEHAARCLGVASFRMKCAAFVTSGVLTALAGALIAAQNTSVEPVSAFGLSFTVDAVVMVVIGGIGTLLGPVIGVLAVFYGIQQHLQGSAELSGLLTGALLLLVVRFAPDGAWPMIRRAIRNLSVRIRG